MSAGKPLATIVAVACGAMVLTATVTASPSSSANPPAKSAITIKPWPKLFGYVKSSKTGCVNNRRVAVFRQKGDKRNSAKDKRVATAVARHYHDTYQWSTGVDARGSFYAKARHEPGCEVAFSKTVRTSPGAGGGPPTCPGSADDVECVFSEVHFDTGGFKSCPNYLKRDSGSCDGSSSGGPGDWDTCASFANFHWNPGGRLRGVAFYVDKCGTFPRVNEAYLEGFVNNDALGRYFATDAWGSSNPDAHFCSPNPPIEGQQAGEEGGPLALNFDNGTIGADVYIHGILVRQGFHGLC
jgi:hypothetical protein